MLRWSRRAAAPNLKHVLAIARLVVGFFPSNAEIPILAKDGLRSLRPTALGDWLVMKMAR